MMYHEAALLLTGYLVDQRRHVRTDTVVVEETLNRAVRSEGNLWHMTVNIPSTLR